MAINQKKVTMLIILDGFGWRKEHKYNAIYHAATPHFDQWMEEYPHAILKASGTAVGLPEGYIGNSEVGHFTIGAGRIIKEPVTQINEAIKDGSFFTNPVLVTALEKIKKSGKTVHLIGLLSDAGVHADIKQINAFIDAAHKLGVQNILFHAFLDGRDMPPQSATPYLQQLEKKLSSIGAQLGSIHGRFYAMDRDENWDRTEQAYRILTEPQKAKKYNSWQQALKDCYQNNITDEFVLPTQLDESAYVKDGDGIIFFNFRSDRARQLTASFIDPLFNEFSKKPIPLAFFVTPTVYDREMKLDALYPQPYLETTLKTVLADHGKTIFSIAETEKYAHVTYFFNGGKEGALATETQTLIPSLSTRDYGAHPEMSANVITQTVLQSLNEAPCDFYLINYANADMVGHTGDFDATVKAVEYLDQQLEKLYAQVVEMMDGTLYITADHGNAEDMYDEKAQQPRTAHTTNNVPFVMIRKKLKGNPQTLPLHTLADIAPFILKNMNLPVPQKMQR